ncbi:Na(+)-translocating NADH-quinone reductase subunit C [Desulfopila inferna]|uniref:Na(+)-translocating NADH-quinone reductase subunit C n=1 Tax=Desulfopila inferna TaxID=468528 RepID=UPI0019652401|nr:Na(+)-translocating NADH-quinone reductase subunit C [Desulfopila inferna]MBM9606577.1 Na(+)-translocating NADH-quinone reductase subunit C [Desulfopila inferna]
MAEESPYKPFYSVLVLAFFCSLLVAGAAVGLRPLQLENQLEDRRKNILLAAGLYDSSKSIDEMFANIEIRIIELSTGEFVPPEVISPEDYDQRKAPMTADMGESIPDPNDEAGLGMLEKYSLVYLVQEEGEISQIVLPIRGKGLWSTLYGYIAIGNDLTTINGISFYEHGETPGLGGEIENPRWQADWQGKKIYDQEYQETLTIGKAPGGKEEIHQIDGLSGATLTTNGVDDIINFWFGGDYGFKPFLTQMKEEGGELNG